MLFADLIEDAMARMDEMEIDPVNDPMDREEMNSVCTYPLINDSFPAIFRGNVAALLASDKNFSGEYLDVFSSILGKYGPKVITDADLSTEMLCDLKLDYENDLLTALLKYNVFSHIFHIEECIRCLDPIIKHQQSASMSPQKSHIKMEFDLGNREVILTNPAVLICATEDLTIDGEFVSYEGRCYIKKRGEFNTAFVEFRLNKNHHVNSEVVSIVNYKIVIIISFSEIYCI